jgi:hypothetical protein
MSVEVSKSYSVAGAQLEGGVNVSNRKLFISKFHNASCFMSMTEDEARELLFELQHAIKLFDVDDGEIPPIEEKNSPSR